MLLIWCSISGHGLGHAAQVVPVLNALGRRVQDIKAVLRTAVPSWFFEGRLSIPWEISPVEQDVGCVQRGPLEIDVAATWAKHLRFHAHWDSRVNDEVRAIRARAPNLLVSDISYLAIEAGARAQVPTVGLCNLSWDLVLELFLGHTGPGRQQGQTDERRLIQQMRRSYGMADLMLRPAPGLQMNAFKKIVDIGPIAQPLVPDRSGLRQAVGAEAGEAVVLVGFGGITLDSLPFRQLERLRGYRFVISGPVPGGHRRTRSTASVPLPFGSLMASADIIVTKPGYSTIVEAVTHSIPVVYVRRYNFADEASLVEYAHRYGRAAELSLDEFTAGRWQQALDAARSASKPADAPPIPTGAAEATHILASLL